MKKYVFVLVAILIMTMFVGVALSSDPVTPTETLTVTLTGAPTTLTVTPTETVPIPSVSIVDQLGNFTKLEISPTNANFRLQLGESKEITVTIKNKDNKTVSVKPNIIIPPYGGPTFDTGWIEVTPDSSEILAGSSQKFRVKASVPKDASIGYYNVMIAFTDEVLPTPYPELFPSYVHYFTLSIDVWAPPKIQISPQYINDQLEAMKEYDYEIKLKNVGDKEIDINPSVGSEGNSGPYGMPPALTESEITVRGPHSIPANATEIVQVHVKVPDSSGYFNGYINLGIDDPSVPDGGRVNLNFNIWKQPTEPFIKEFRLEKQSPITIEITSSSYGTSPTSKEKNKPSFETILAAPKGASNLKVSKEVIKGGISLGGDIPPWEIDSKSIYQETGTQYIETYTVEGTEGKYTLSMLPRNVPGFEYSITIGGD
jgi:hypothetical protein